MNRRFIPIALLLTAAAAGAQMRTAVEVTSKTVNTVNERTAAMQSEHDVVTQGSAPTQGQQGAAPAQGGAQDSATARAAGAGAAQATAIQLSREVYQYDGGGRRDPFLSLTRSGALRPHISELTLVVAMVQTNGERSIATIRDNTTKEQYIVRVGDSLGRYRVVRIEPRAVTFAIEEFGFSRQERLVMGDTTTVRNQ